MWCGVKNGKYLHIYNLIKKMSNKSEAIINHLSKAFNIRWSVILDLSEEQLINPQNKTIFSGMTSV